MSNSVVPHHYEPVLRDGLEAVRPVADRLLAETLAASGADTASVMLLDVDGAMRIVASHGIPREIVDNCSQRPGDGIAGWVLVTGKSVTVGDRPGGCGQRGRLASAVSAPIVDGTGIAGVVNAGWRDRPGVAETALPTIEALARLGATAIASRCRKAHAGKNASAPATPAIECGECTDETRRIAEIATAIAEILDLDRAETQTLRLAAIVHDVGMHAGGGRLSDVSGPLSTTETALVRMHPFVAAERVRLVSALEPVVPVVLHHHERYDGSGYVSGLAGEAIPLEARILAVADAFVAMTSERPHRHAETSETALSTLRAAAGSQFDPVVVDALFEHFSENRMAAQ